MSVDVQLDVISVHSDVGGSHVWIKCPALKLTIAYRSLQAVCYCCVICARSTVVIIIRHQCSQCEVAATSPISFPLLSSPTSIVIIPVIKKRLVMGKVVRMRTDISGGMVSWRSCIWGSVRVRKCTVLPVCYILCVWGGGRS